MTRARLLLALLGFTLALVGVLRNQRPVVFAAIGVLALAIAARHLERRR